MSFVVPEACTLPTAEQPLRLGEFDAVFATAVREVETVTPTHARLRLAGAPGLAATVRDLTTRETECCTFFTFTITPEPAADGGALILDVVVPARYTDVLASLVARASAMLTPAGMIGPAGLRTGELADQAGVNIQTVRYYERRGLLAEPVRTNGGHRLYPPDTVALLTVIKAAQRLGFTLDEVAELLDAGRRRHPTADLRQRALDKISEIDAKVADLATIRTTLTGIVDARCDSLLHCTCPDCPIPG